MAKIEYAIWGTKNGAEDIVRINGEETQTDLKKVNRYIEILKERGEFDKLRIQKIDYSDSDLKKDFIKGVNPKSQDANISSGVIRLTDRVMITGMTGTGKTFFCKWFIKNHLLGKIKVFIYDCLWQYQDLGDVFHSLDAIDNAALQDKTKAIVFQPDAESDNELIFDSVAKWILERQNIFFIAEEFSYYINSNYSPPNFEALVKRGRNYGIGILGISQRPARIDLNFIGVVNHWIIFPQDCKPDLERLFTYLERANGEFNQDFIASMPDRHFIHYWRDRDTGRPSAVFSKPVKDDSIKTEPTK